MTSPARASYRWFSRERVDIAVQVLVLAVFFGAWEITAQLRLVHPFLLPTLSDVLARIGKDMWSGQVARDVALTLYRAAAGFGLAAALGIPLGILMARSAAARWFFEPLVSFGFPMPKLAFLPVFILWFDIFDTSKIVMVTFTCIFIIASTAYAGARGVEKWPVWSARALGCSERSVLWEVILPMAMPQILTGLQIALPSALIATIVVEMLMGGEGLGASMLSASRYADSTGVFAGILEVAIVGMLVIRGAEYARRRLLVWHAEARK